MDLPIEYVSDPLFEALPADGIIPELEAADAPNDEQGRRWKNPAKAPPGLPPYLASLYATPLLSKAQEAFLFRKMNYLKFRAARLRKGLHGGGPQTKTLNQIERLLAQSGEARNSIMSANLRLVVSIAKKFVNGGNTFDELVSEGNMPLFRAVELFDVGKGFRFSTYATWAIRNHLQRFSSDRQKFRQRFVASNDYVASWTADERPSIGESEAKLKRQRILLSKVMSLLTKREQHIVEARFGLDDSRQPHTLSEIGRELGISKERVRQLATSAIEKVQDLVEVDEFQQVGLSEAI